MPLYQELFLHEQLRKDEFIGIEEFWGILPSSFSEEETFLPVETICIHLRASFCVP